MNTFEFNHNMQDFSTRDASPQDPLFYERLEAFMDKSIADIKAFADRESRPFEETRQYVAEWHSRYLFNPPLATAEQNNILGVTTPFTASKVRTVLYNASRLLESLNEVTGMESFVLAVDPADPADQGFLGGTLAGREFWRGLRGGGSPGAIAFKTYCCKRIEAQQPAPPPPPQSVGESSRAPTPASKYGPAKSLKADLYDAIRSALRTASGVRNAEMKWSNHEKLDVYGVRVLGWPSDVPNQNPSSLKVNQNKKIFECLKNGTLRFEKLYPPTSETSSAAETPQSSEPDEDFSWAYDPDAGESPEGSGRAMYPPSADTTSSQSSNPRAPSSPDEVDFATWIHSSPNGSRSNSMEPRSRKRQRQLSKDHGDT